MATKRNFSFPVEDTDFKKSSFSPVRRGSKCLLIAKKPEGVAVRDSKDSNKTTLYFKNGEWEAFVKAAKNGEFD